MQRLLNDKLKQKCFRVDVASTLRNESSHGCVHKKCFVSIKNFADQLLDKLDAAIEKMPRLPPQDNHDDSHSEATPVRLQSKRTLSSISEEQSTSKCPRLIFQFNPSQCPGVHT